MRQGIATAVMILSLNAGIGVVPESSFSKKETETSINSYSKEQLFEKDLQNYYAINKEPIDKWIALMNTPEGKRTAFDKFTIDILDTINIDKASIRRYFNSIPSDQRKRTLTFLGREERLKTAFQRLDKYSDIMEHYLNEKNLPLIFRYIPVIESHLTTATSKAKAQGYWQIMKGTAKGMTINSRIDERNSLIHSTRKGTELLEMGLALYEGVNLAATQYIVGNYGQTKYLEKMLEVDGKGEVFDSYSTMILFHQPNECRIYDYETFSKRFRASGKAIWSYEIRKNKAKMQSNETLKKELYEKYVNESLGGDTTRTYLQSFFSFYNLDADPDSVYWKYHDFLKGTKDNFDTPNYVLRLYATAVMHKQSFEYEKAPLIPFENIETIHPSKKELAELMKDPEFRELNMHINKSAVRKYDLGKETEIFKIKK